MVLREQKKMEKGEELTRDEKSNLRRKKLKQVRADMGGQVGRPKQATKGGMMGRADIAMARDIEMSRVRDALGNMGADISQARSKGVLRFDEQPSDLTAIGQVDYIYQPNNPVMMDGEVVIAKNLPYKYRFTK